MKKLILVLAVMVSVSATAAEKASIIGMSDDKSVIKLDNGTVWSVDSSDQYEVSTWLVGEDVVINDNEDQLFDIDDNSSAAVEQVN